MFDIGTGELLALAVLALLVLGPDKLPKYAAEAARFIRQVRTMANDARSEVRRELGPELDGLNLAELNPRALVRRQLLDGIDDDDDERVTRPREQRSPAPRPRTPGDGTPSTAYDPDTT